MGIYFHIPFCKQACNYCDFHFSTSQKYKTNVLSAMLKEIHLRKDEFAHHTIDTIYFGGGTPSVLSAQEIEQFLTELQKITTISHKCEITLEANPDDLSKQYIKELTYTPINRFSIGTQSFHNDDLKFMNRAHSAVEAVDSIKLAQDLGFTNINIDLIYGSPTTSNEMWEENLSQWFLLEVPHLSSYCLTVEKNTTLHHQIINGISPPINDEKSSQQFELLRQFVKEKKITHYEISNFCKGESFAKHNTNYWFGKPYIGIGPSAHSYDGHKKRRWNVSNNRSYIKAIENNTSFFEEEILSATNRYNEYVLTRLRTMWGLNKFEIEDKFGTKKLKAIEFYVDSYPDYFQTTAFSITLSENGLLFADKISSDLFE